MIPPLMPCLPKPFQNDGPAVAAPVGRSPTAFNPDVESLISVHVTVLPSTLLEPEWLITYTRERHRDFKGTYLDFIKPSILEKLPTNR